MYVLYMRSGSAGNNHLQQSLVEITSRFMAKHNKLRYQVKEKPKVTIVLTGVVFLQYVDDEAALHAKKGDLLVYPNNEALHSTRLGEYGSTGFTGYFKVDIADGKTWQPLLLNELFENKEHHFSKSERPIDTYNICAEILRNKAGMTVIRTYREHYQLQIN